MTTDTIASRPRIAAITTTYFPRSHADVIVTKFLRGFPTDEGLIPPRTEIASLYIDQIADHDVGVATAAEFAVPIYPSIRQALTLGGDVLAVDGVLLIAEHGDYAWNEKEQCLFPRRPFFEQIGAVFARSGRSVPVFNDKHLSYNWADARWMVERSRELGVPLMAGSSLPFAWRRPWLELETGTPVEEALALAYGGLEVYGFHGLETLQCMVERRQGAETGVRSVTCLEGDAVWDAGDRGLWSWELFDAAYPLIEGGAADPRRVVGEPAAFVIEYVDGLRAAVLLLNGAVQNFAFAMRSGGAVRATEFYLQGGDPFGHFSYLSLNVEEMFLTGRPTYPVERTLLATGVLDAAMTSRHQGHRRLETPELSVAYRACESVPWRPTAERPCGATLAPFPVHVSRD